MLGGFTNGNAFNNLALYAHDVMRATIAPLAILAALEKVPISLGARSRIAHPVHNNGSHGVQWFPRAAIGIDT